MRKLFLTLSVLFMSICGFAQITYYQSNYVPSPMFDGRQYWVWQYQIAGPDDDFVSTNTFVYGIDYLQFNAVNNLVPSKNNNTRLLGVNNSGEITPYDVTALPKQSLSVSGQSLTISNGNTITLPTQTETDPIWNSQKSSYSTKTVADGLYKPISYTPTLTLSGNSLSAGGNSVTIDPSSTNELQTLSLTTNTLTLSSGNSVTLPTYNQTLSVSGNSISISNGNTITIPSSSSTYTNSGTVAGGAGNVVFYLTNDKTSTGTALYSSMPTVIPIVNDASTNYTYGWTLSPDFKTLTVNVKTSSALNIAALGITVLGVPANVANGTAVRVTIN